MKIGEIERQYLGAAMVRAEVLANYPVKSEMFTRDEHKRLHAVMIGESACGRSLDLVNLVVKCDGQSWFPGAAWLSTLVDSIPSAEIAKTAAREIVKDFKRRSFREWLTVTAGVDMTDPDEALDLAQAKLIDLRTQSVTKPFVSFDDSAKEWLGSMSGDNPSTVIETGVKEVDDNWLFGRGGLHLIAGRAGMGKTTLASWVMERMAARGHPVMFFSLEMTRAEVVSKIVSAWAWRPLERSVNLSESDYKAAMDAVSSHRDFPIYISDEGGQTIERISMISQFAKLSLGVEAIFVDYIQLVRTVERIESREQAVALVSRELKAMAKRLNLPVIAMSQLNRNSEARADKRPTMADLRESGSLEQDADSVALIYRPEYYMIREKKIVPLDMVGLAEIIIEKQRRTGPKIIIGKRQRGGSYTWGEIEKHPEAYNENRWGD